MIKVTVFDGNEKMINTSLNNAANTGDWILVENLHAGQQEWLEMFSRRVARLQEQSSEN